MQATPSEEVPGSAKVTVPQAKTDKKKRENGWKTSRDHSASLCVWLLWESVCFDEKKEESEEEEAPRLHTRC